MTGPGGGEPAARAEPRGRLRRARPVLVAAWVLVVLAAAAVVAVREWDQMADRAGSLSVPLLAAGLVATAAAKLALGENARLAAGGHGIVLSFAAALRLYNLSQLGKYVPGSVWQFVGRAVAYRDRSARYGDIRDALVTESLWIVAGAAVVGLSLGGVAVVPAVTAGVAPSTARWLLVGAIAVVAAIALTVIVRGRRAAAGLARYARLAVPGPRAALTQAAVWTLLGTGFWFFCRAAEVPVTWPFAVGLFAAAYALGFLVLLAPAGLGVRDAVLVAGLLPLAGAETGLLVAVVARLGYVLVELALVAVGEGWLLLTRRRVRVAGTPPPGAPAAAPPP